MNSSRFLLVLLVFAFFIASYGENKETKKAIKYLNKKLNKSSDILSHHKKLAKHLDVLLKNNSNTRDETTKIMIAFQSLWQGDPEQVINNLREVVKAFNGGTSTSQAAKKKSHKWYVISTRYCWFSFIDFITHEKIIVGVGKEVQLALVPVLPTLLKRSLQNCM